MRIQFSIAVLLVMVTVAAFITKGVMYWEKERKIAPAREIWKQSEQGLTLWQIEETMTILHKNGYDSTDIGVSKRDLITEFIKSSEHVFAQPNPPESVDYYFLAYVEVIEHRSGRKISEKDVEEYRALLKSQLDNPYFPRTPDQSQVH